MADYRLSAKVISRSTGASSVASACYRTGERMHDIRLGQTFDFTRKQDVVYTEVMLPEHAPQEWSSPELLWNAVEASERRKDAQLAREVQISLPCELSREQNIELAREFAQEQFINRGMVAHISVHEKGNNPHAHIMLTTRECDEDGFTLKNRDWNDKELLVEWRKEWELVQNRHLERYYEQERVPEHERQYVDCRSLADQGIDREPQIHMGRAYEIEQREQQKAREEGREYEPVTDRGERMQEIMQQNAQREIIAMQIRQLELERKREYDRVQQQQQQRAREFEQQRSAAASRVESLEKQVSEIRQNVEQREQEISRSQGAREDCEQRLERVHEQVRNIEGKAYQLDSRAGSLEPAAEHAREWRDTPKAERSSLLDRVIDICREVRAEIDRRVDSIRERIRDISSRPIGERILELGGRIEELRERNQELRVDAKGYARDCREYYADHRLEIRAQGQKLNEGMLQPLGYDKQLAAQRELSLGERADYAREASQELEYTPQRVYPSYEPEYDREGPDLSMSR